MAALPPSAFVHWHPEMLPRPGNCPPGRRCAGQPVASVFVARSGLDRGIDPDVTSARYRPLCALRAARPRERAQAIGCKPALTRALSIGLAAQVFSLHASASNGGDQCADRAEELRHRARPVIEPPPDPI